jgi:hypothetical protein
MSQENNITQQPSEVAVEKNQPHEIKLAESYLEEKLKEFFQGKEETIVKPFPGGIILNLVSEDATPASILDTKTVTNTATVDTMTANATDISDVKPKVSVRALEQQGGHPVNINTICLFACKTVEEFNKAGNFMMSSVEKLNAAKDIVDKVIDKVVVFVPENQRRQFSKNIHHGLSRVEEIIEFIVEISRYPNWVNSEKWIMNTLDDLKPRCRFIPCIDRDLKNKIAKRQKESKDLLEAEKKASKEEKLRVDKLLAEERAEADKKAKQEIKAKKEMEKAEAKEEARKKKDQRDTEKKAAKAAKKESKAKTEEPKPADVELPIVVAEPVVEEKSETVVEETAVVVEEKPKELTEAEKLKEEIKKMQQALADKEKEDKRLAEERKKQEKQAKKDERKRKEEEIKRLKDELKKI